MKELRDVVLKVRETRKIAGKLYEKGEPILYFDRINISRLSETSTPKMAQGGWGNTTWVTWDDEGDLTFTIQEGVISQIGLGLLMRSQMLEKINVRTRACEVPLLLDENGRVELRHAPIIDAPNFCLGYELNHIQDKIKFSIDGTFLDCGTSNALRTVLFEYYFIYEKPVLVYLIKKERFNNQTFTLEGTFVANSENTGIRQSCLLTMPQVSINSNINLSLGENRAPSTSTFTITAMAGPSQFDNNYQTKMEIIRLEEDLNSLS